MPKLVYREALIKTSIQLTPEQYQQVAQIARREDRKIANVVRQAVDRYIADKVQEQEQVPA